MKKKTSLTPLMHKGGTKTLPGTLGLNFGKKKKAAPSILDLF